MELSEMFKLTELAGDNQKTLTGICYMALKGICYMALVHLKTSHYITDHWVDPVAAQVNGHKLFISVVVPMAHEEHSFPDIIKWYHQHQFEQSVLSSNINLSLEKKKV